MGPRSRVLVVISSIPSDPLSKWASLGPILRCVREDAGLTQLELARRMGKSRTMVSRAELGRLHIGGCYAKAVLRACRLQDSRVAMSADHPIFHSFRDYVRVEEDSLWVPPGISPVKFEYLVGHITAMGIGTPKHAALATVIAAKLTRTLRGGRCRVYNSNLRIRVRETGLCAHPDVSVIHGPRELDPEDKNTVTNPILIVEVTSKNTEGYDRGEKFEHYRQIPTLQEYVLVSHRRQAIEVRRRPLETGGRWASHGARAGGRAELSSVGGSLDVDAIYQAAAESRRPFARPLRRTLT